MSRRLLGIALLAGLIAAPAQAQVPFSRTLVPTRTSLARVGLEKNWMGVIPLGGTTERVLRISLAENLLFAQTNMANFHAFDAETGRYLWGVNLGTPTKDARPASVNSNMVFTTNSQDLYALDRGTGRLIWKKHLEDLPASPTAADENLAMVGLRSGKLVAYTTRDRTKAKPPGPSAATFKWAWRTNAEMTGRPIPADRVVAFGSRDGKVYVALMESSTLLFRYLTGGPIIASMGTYGTRTLLVPSGDNNLYAIDLFTGETRWTYPSGAPIEQEPLVSGNDVLIVNTAGMLTSLDPVKGNVRWSVPTGHGRLIALSPTRAYLETFDLDMVVVDRVSGRVLSDASGSRDRSGLNLREYTLVPTNRLNDRLYFGTPSGFLICLREIGQTAPRPLRELKSQKFGYMPREGTPATPPESPTSPDADTTEPPADTTTPATETPAAEADKPAAAGNTPEPPK